MTENRTSLKHFSKLRVLHAMQDAELIQCDVIIRMIRWVEDVARMWRGRKIHTWFWWENLKRLLAKPKRRGNIKMALQEIEWQVVKSHLTQNRDKWQRLLHTVINLRVA